MPESRALAAPGFALGFEPCSVGQADVFLLIANPCQRQKAAASIPRGSPPIIGRICAAGDRLFPDAGHRASFRGAAFDAGANRLNRPSTLDKSLADLP